MTYHTTPNHKAQKWWRTRPQPTTKHKRDDVPGHSKAQKWWRTRPQPTTKHKSDDVLGQSQTQSTNVMTYQATANRRPAAEPPPPPCRSGSWSPVRSEAALTGWGWARRPGDLDAGTRRTRCPCTCLLGFRLQTAKWWVNKPARPNAYWPSYLMTPLRTPRASLSGIFLQSPPELVTFVRAF